MRHIFFLLIVVGVFLAACRAPKSAVRKDHRSNEQERKELSNRLNLELDAKDNLQLYKVISNWIGVKHKDGGCDRRGIDCSCFVRMVYDSVYQKKLPRSSGEMFKYAAPVDTISVKEGDLVFFTIKTKQVSHVGLVLKNKWFVHVSSTKGVAINHLSEAYYKKYLTGAGKIR